MFGLNIARVIRGVESLCLDKVDVANALTTSCDHPRISGVHRFQGFTDGDKCRDWPLVVKVLIVAGSQDEMRGSSTSSATSFE